jgi:hypothetical protein
MTINDERRWDEMIIFLGKEIRRLKDSIEGWEEEEESDSGKEICGKLGLEKLEPKDLRKIIDRQRRRKKFIQNLREILKEVADK